MICAAPLGHLVLAMIGHMRVPLQARRWRAGLYGFAIVVAGTGWLLPAQHAFALSTFGGFLVGAVALALSIRRARRGDRLAGLAIAGVVAIWTTAARRDYIACSVKIADNGNVPTMTETDTSSVPRSPRVSVSCARPLASVTVVVFAKMPPSSLDQFTVTPATGFPY